MAHFNVEAHLHRLTGRSKDIRHIEWVRHYGKIETAVRRCMEYLITEGQVGDVIEFVLKKISGMQVGTIRYHATGKIDVVWNNTEAKRIRNERELERTNPNSVKRLLKAAGQPRGNAVH